MKSYEYEYQYEQVKNERLRDELALPILYVSHDRSEVERLAGQVVPVGL